MLLKIIRYFILFFLIFFITFELFSYFLLDLLGSTYGLDFSIRGIIISAILALILVAIIYLAENTLVKINIKQKEDFENTQEEIDDEEEIDALLDNYSYDPTDFEEPDSTLPHLETGVGATSQPQSAETRREEEIIRNMAEIKRLIKENGELKKEKQLVEYAFREKLDKKGLKKEAQEDIHNITDDYLKGVDDASKKKETNKSFLILKNQKETENYYSTGCRLPFVADMGEKYMDISNFGY